MATRPCAVNAQAEPIAAPKRRSYKPPMARPPQSHRPHGAKGPRRFPPRSKAERQSDRLWIYGVHPVAAALANPRRAVLRILATDNARQRLEGVERFKVEPTTPKELTRLLGPEAVHQGVAAEVEPLPALALDALPDGARLLLFLDQVTDPHNVGAILRSAAAMAADAVVVTSRYSPAETGVLAKAASGALDVMPLISVSNLSRALEEVGAQGFFRVGLDSSGESVLEDKVAQDKLALVLGAEGRGLRQKTRETCDTVARLDLPGDLRSLNVSNAAALSLYLARRALTP